MKQKYSHNTSQVLIILVTFFILFTITTVSPQLQSQSKYSADPDESFCTTVPDKKDGVCISLNTQIKHCPKLKSFLKSRNKTEWELLRQSFCSSAIENGRVCCPIEGNGSYQEDSKRDLEPDYKSHKNWELFSLNNTQCGLVSSSNRILGGQDAILAQFPWMARIGYLQNNSTPLFSCSGAIINKRYILSAAHCLSAYRQGYKLAQIRIAETDDTENPEFYYNFEVYYRDFDIEEVLIHPNYTGKIASPHDIALIRLKQEILNLTTDYFARAICLPFVKEYKLGNQLDEAEMVLLRDDESKIFRPVVAGWGKTDNKANVGSTTLQYLDVPVQPSISCRILYGDMNFSNKQLCVGGEEERNSCLGDSGGCLMYNAAHSITKNINVVRKFQIGIVSFGRSECGKKGVPVVYTRVRNYLTWILDTVRE